jgi:hypothetical protein
MIFALLVVQEVTKATLRKSKPVPGSHVEVSDADCPRSFEGRLGVLVGMLVEFVAEGDAAKSEAKCGLEYLFCAICHGVRPFR